MKKIFTLLVFVFFAYLNPSYAKELPIYNKFLLTSAPLPTSCVQGTFTQTGSICQYEVSIKITNNCGKDVDFQNSSMTFLNGDNLVTGFWGDFLPLSYPDNTLQITSQPAIPSGFLASLMLHFPETPTSRTILHDKESFTIKYGTMSPSYNPFSLNVYISGPPVVSGKIDLTNATSKPTTVDQPYALVDISFNGQKINTVQVPWGQTLSVPDLAPGVYTLNPQTITDINQNLYQGTATPSSVTVQADTTSTSTIRYQLVVQPGTINVKTPVLPTALVGYTGLPLVTFTRLDTGATVNKNVPWNATTPVTSLENNVTYQISTPVITFNNNRCVGSFTPSSILSKITAPLTTELSYICSPILLDRIVFNISGVPCDVTRIALSLQPNDGSAKITKFISIVGGKGSDFLNLTDGVSYTVNTTDLDGYSFTVSLQPLIAKPNVVENIVYFPHAKVKRMSN